MIRHYLWAVIQNCLIFTLMIPIIVIGLVVVPVALIFADDSQKDATYKRSDRSEWWLRRLPRWALLWDNPFDGFLGDEHFRWADRDAPFGWRNTDFLAQWWWGAIRNPAHYLKDFLLPCDIRRCTFTKLQGQDFVRDRPDATGYQFLMAKRDDGIRYYRIFWVWQWPWTPDGVDRAVIFEMGHEFRGSHWADVYEEEYEYLKGFSFIIHPCKEI